MLEILLQSPSDLAQTLTWRVRFHKGDTPQAHTGTDDNRLVFQEPEATTAELTSTSPEEVNNTPQADDVFFLTWIPFEIAASLNFEKEDERALKHEALERSPRVLRASIRNARVYWTNTEAIYVCDQQHVESIKNALLRFTLLQRHVSGLEHDVKSYWQKIQTNIELTLPVKISALDECLTLSDQQLAETTHMKMSYLRSNIALEQLEASLGNTAKRLFEELALAASLHDRLELLDNSIQFMYDYCINTNQRVSERESAIKEKRYYTFGLALEIIIILLLIVGIWGSF